MSLAVIIVLLVVIVVELGLALRRASRTEALIDRAATGSVRAITCAVSELRAVLDAGHRMEVAMRNGEPVRRGPVT